MSFFEAVKHAFVYWLNNKGRACRSEYWYFFLFYILARFAVQFLDVKLGLSFSLSDGFSYGMLNFAFDIFMMAPSLTLTIRRLHDTGRSDVWLLSLAIPFGFLVFLYLVAQDSQPGENKYGPNPKDVNYELPINLC
ncbi:DUF805 domain-containing protein [bacterium]|nr:DUF805 domain-containing protein [bacterium]